MIIRDDPLRVFLPPFSEGPLFSKEWIASELKPLVEDDDAAVAKIRRAEVKGACGGFAQV